MMSIRASSAEVEAERVAAGRALPIVMALAFSHFLNDLTQSLMPALYPMLKGSHGLSFVYALDLVPSRTGTIAGLFFGLSFGLAGVGAALLGRFADDAGIDFICQVCAFLPAVGLLTAVLPNLGPATPAPAR